MSARPVADSDPVRELLNRDRAEVDAAWKRIQLGLADRFGRTPGIEAALFLIGIREKGEGFARRLKKEEKQDLIMQGTCHVFERAGIYRRLDSGEWERMTPLPVLDREEQERLLLAALVGYFENNAWSED